MLPDAALIRYVEADTLMLPAGRRLAVADDTPPPL